MKTKKPFPLGAGTHDADVNFEVLNDDAWWQPMTDEEIDALFGLEETGSGLTRMLS